MAARRFHSGACSKSLRAHSITVVLLFTATLVTTLTSQALSLAVSDSGRWTPPHTTTGVAIHLTLLPGDSTRFHSEVLWWSGLNDEQGPFDGGLWGWRPAGYNCTIYPDTNVLKDIALPVPASGVFCGSGSHLADGRLFVAGGSQPGTENGVRHVYVFDPTHVTWSQVDSMSEARWYATSTALADGRQLVTSGSKDLYINFFGGLRNDETVPRDKGLFRYGVGYNGHADPAVYTGSGTEWPSPREGHTMVLNGALNMFGGRDSLNNFNNDFWRLLPGQNVFGADFDYKWEHYDHLSGPPPARWDHSAVATLEPPATMIVFGGIKKVEGSDVVADDVWRLWFDASVPGWKWTQVSIQSSPESPAPGPRCGHVAFYHEGDRRMFLFGGRSTPTGTPSDGALWCLNFDSQFNTATWQKLNAVGPSPRYDHAGVYDPTWVHADTTTHIDST